MNPELKRSFNWTSALVLPFLLVGGYFFQIHSGPGGYWFLIGLAFFLPLMILHDYVFPAIPAVSSGFFGIAIMLIFQFLYWFLIVHFVRLLIKRIRHDKKIAPNP